MANTFTINDEVSDEAAYLCETDFPVSAGTLFILIFIISVIGNGLLLCVLFIYEKLTRVTNIFILNLTCSDLIFTITLPFWAVDHLHQWVFGDFVCKFMTAAFFVGLYSSVILLTAMTVDRFIKVVLHKWPSNRARKKYAISACISAWVISISASLSDAMKVKVVKWDGFEYCENGSDEKLGRYLQVSLLFFLPFAIIIFCYSAILKTVLQGLKKKKHTTVALLLCIVAAFFISWGPYHIMLLINSLYTPKGCKAQECLSIIYHISEMLAYSHCCMNPLLYMISQDSQKHLFNLLCCEKLCRKNREKDTSQKPFVIQNVAFTAESSVVKSN
ncbi:chemokine XC receptor 1 isoform X1 [Oreochromis niloticus]|uniref:chemokine XC receptor 1 isoform X1 n=1 Tax=Oreochromis niloticus TaxID=8128 RepID=UPI00039467CD|nr:chemokine XC receptor 1 isoform X1 [Oreochromis niloticus]XP_019203442.1 chemokine XC receptor 1 isoform X1 [Oreochromis niloticus]